MADQIVLDVNYYARESAFNTIDPQVLLSAISNAIKSTITVTLAEYGIETGELVVKGNLNTTNLRAMGPERLIRRFVSDHSCTIDYGKVHQPTEHIDPVIQNLHPPSGGVSGMRRGH